MDQCCIKINVSSESKPLPDSKFKFCLYRGNSIGNEASIDIEQYRAIISQFTSDTAHYNSHKKFMPASAGRTMQYHIKKKYEDDRPHTEDVVRLCDITAKTVRAYINDEVEDYKFEVIVKFCLGFRLSVPYIEDLLSKANIRIDPSNIARSALMETLRL